MSYNEKLREILKKVYYINPDPDYSVDQAIADINALSPTQSQERGASEVDAKALLITEDLFQNMHRALCEGRGCVVPSRGAEGDAVLEEQVDALETVLHWAGEAIGLPADAMLKERD